jgi:hypothetical protein
MENTVDFISVIFLPRGESGSTDERGEQAEDVSVSDGQNAYVPWMSWSLRPETERGLESSIGLLPKMSWPCMSYNLLAETLHGAARLLHPAHQHSTIGTTQQTGLTHKRASTTQSCQKSYEYLMTCRRMSCSTCSFATWNTTTSRRFLRETRSGFNNAHRLQQYALASHAPGNHKK